MKFPAPENKDELMKFLGMAKFLARFIQDLSARTFNLRSLLKNDVTFIWLDAHQQEFDALKKLISSDLVVQYYDPDLPIRITTDASRKGLGAVLQQKHANEKWLPVAFASRSLTEAESRYATIEQETLAIEFACTRFHQYIFGQEVELETDHKSLVSIFKKSLNSCPARIQSMRLKLRSYDLRLTHTPGKELVTADT
jgi:hypothetical protein